MCKEHADVKKDSTGNTARIVQAMYDQSLKRIRETIARDCEKELENILSALSADAIKAVLYKV